MTHNDLLVALAYLASRCAALETKLEEIQLKLSELEKEKTKQKTKE